MKVFQVEGCHLRRKQILTKKLYYFILYYKTFLYIFYIL